jgi:hypothetical protein
VPSAKRPKPAVPIKRRQLEIRPIIVEEFVADMHASFAAPDWLKKNEIAVRQVRALREYQARIRLIDIKRMFEMMHAELPAKRTAPR